MQVHVQPQTELFNYVIRQLNSRDLTYSLVGVTRNVRDDDLLDRLLIPFLV